MLSLWLLFQNFAIFIHNDLLPNIEKLIKNTQL